jgi:hypothetical protein
MEDLFDVASVSRGLDRAGHLGYAAQPGLAPFGPDVFNNPLRRPERPRPTPDVGGIVRASLSHPRLAIEGDTVAVTLGDGRGLATIVGPAVAEPGAIPPTTVRSTFTATIATRFGMLPLSTAAFTIIDEQGHVHRPSLSTASGRPLPSRIVPGHPVTLRLTTVLPVGAGLLAWAPRGSTPVVSWDFDVETA